jgi:hypothetical protein
MSKFFGILVVYYPEKYRKAIEKFKKLLRSVSNEFIILIVVNNPNLLVGENADFEVLYNEIDSTSEFQGYFCGLSYLNEKYQIPLDSLVVVANDTFASHQHYSLVDKILFVKALKRIYCSNNCIVGEVNSFGEVLDVGGYAFSRWVSTYLFALNGLSVNYLLNLNIINMGQFPNRESIIDIQKSSMSFASKRTIKRIDLWLLPGDSKRGWRGSNSMSPDTYLRKVVAILNEYQLSAKISEKGKIINVYSNFLSKTYLRLRHFAMRHLK